MTPSSKVALVTGASGIQGLSLLKKLVDMDEWSHIRAVARSELPVSSSKITQINLDLNDKDALSKGLREQGGPSVTHVFHLAFQGDTSNTDKTTFIWMANIVEALEKLGAPLEHVYFTQGGKYYGVHLGLWDQITVPWKDEPLKSGRHLPPNFYYDQEDWAIERVEKGAKWTWSATRPSAIIGYSLGYMNALHFIATYGTLCKELGAPLRYPGSPDSFHVLNECVDVDLLTKCMLWLADTPSAHNSSYNVCNGDLFRWSQLWPALAEWFGIETAPPQKIPLASFMPKHEKTWKQIREKYALKDIPYDKLAQAEFAEMLVNIPQDAFTDVTKLRKAGFDGQKLWTRDVYVKWLNELAKQKIIPDYPALRKEADT
ncbi:hypothetical protein CVIRNUC_008559 [Coccomyxa viridis]|uniref:PRISE-like Rossmann-fold domain-containing protein n=1 Tax=Coccomyxa viridis TaxID=1274662 RepID=A0AAV1IGL8_9CHLO|nr:hypothetical protein CVIRNUC_008559 [Coccomyxa viridis]